MKKIVLIFSFFSVFLFLASTSAFSDGVNYRDGASPVYSSHKVSEPSRRMVLEGKSRLNAYSVCMMVAEDRGFDSWVVCGDKRQVYENCRDGIDFYFPALPSNKKRNPNYAICNRI